MRKLLEWMSPSLRRERKRRVKNGEVYYSDLKWRRRPIQQWRTVHHWMDKGYIKGSRTPYTGKIYELHENGQKRFELNIKDGIADGLIVVWFENGQKMSESNYKDGEPVGQWLQWYDNGQKFFEHNFKDGYAVGVWTWWHADGQKWREEHYMYEGILQSELYWNRKGEPVDSEEEALEQ